MMIKPIEASAVAEFVGDGGYVVRRKFGKRQPYSPAVLPIIAVHTEILLECLE